MSGSDKPPLPTGKRAVVDAEGHGDRRLINTNKGQRVGKTLGTDGGADVNIRYSGNTNNFANAGALYFGSLQSCKTKQFDHLGVLPGMIIVTAYRNRLGL